MENMKGVLLYTTPPSIGIGSGYPLPHMTSMDMVCRVCECVTQHKPNPCRPYTFRCEVCNHTKVHMVVGHARACLLM